MIKRVILVLSLLSSVVFAQGEIEGAATQEKFYYKSGAVKKILWYADGEPFLEEEFYEDGTLREKKFHKGGIVRTIETRDTIHEIYRVDGKIKITKKNPEDIEITQTNKDEFTWNHKQAFWGADTVYKKRYYQEDLSEDKRGMDSTTKKAYSYGLLSSDEFIARFRDSEEKDRETSYKFGILVKTDEGETNWDESEIEYFLNGNKKYENIVFRDDEGERHHKERFYDESENLLSEMIFVGTNRMKDNTEIYEKYKETIKDDKPYRINYLDGQTAYEKYFTENNVKIERYYTKEGILTFEGEYYPEPYKCDIKIPLFYNYIDYKTHAESRKLRNIKSYSSDGQPIYMEKFEDNERFIKFETTSYHKNGKTYYNLTETITKNSDGINEMTYDLSRYDDNGIIRYNMTADDKIERQKFYDEDGKILEEYVVEFERETASEIKTYIYYYKNGNKRKEDIRERNYKTKERNNLIRTYFLNGELENEEKKEEKR